jgi:hypothetical protein
MTYRERAEGALLSGRENASELEIKEAKVWALLALVQVAEQLAQEVGDVNKSLNHLAASFPEKDGRLMLDITGDLIHDTP